MNFTNELLDFAAASVNWNLITVPFLLAFLFIQYKSLWAGMWSICIKILYLYSWKAWKYMDFIFMFWLRVKIFFLLPDRYYPKIQNYAAGAFASLFFVDPLYWDLSNNPMVSKGREMELEFKLVCQPLWVTKVSFMA